MVQQKLSSKGSSSSITGALLYINNSAFGSLQPFVGQMVNYSRGLKKFNRSCAYWTDTGEGALSNALAKAAAMWIHEALEFPDVRQKRLPESMDWRNSPKYEEWKTKQGYGSLYGRLTGSLSHNIVARKNPAGGGYAVGIRPGVMPIPVRNPLSWFTVLPVSVYTQVLERRAGEGRAMIAPLMTTWLQKQFPEWAKAFNKYWRVAYLTSEQRKDVKGKGSGGTEQTGGILEGDISNKAITNVTPEVQTGINQMQAAARALADFNMLDQPTKKEIKDMGRLMGNILNGAGIDKDKQNIIQSAIRNGTLMGLDPSLFYR